MNFDNNGYRFAQRIGKDECINRDKTLPRIDTDSEIETKLYRESTKTVKANR